MYIAPGQGGIQLPGDKVLMSTETSCHIGHLFLVSNHRQQLFLKNPLFTIFPHKSVRDQIWTCLKIGQGQTGVIIWIKVVVLEHPMQHTKFECQRPFGSGEEDFLRFIQYMAMAATLVMWHGPFEKPSFSHPMEAAYEIWLWLAERFKECGRRPTTDGQRSLP